VCGLPFPSLAKLHIVVLVVVAFLLPEEFIDSYNYPDFSWEGGVCVHMYSDLYSGERDENAKIVMIGEDETGSEDNVERILPSRENTLKF
jgi:hypothetical protein